MIFLFSFFATLIAICNRDICEAKVHTIILDERLKYFSNPFSISFSDIFFDFIVEFVESVNKTSHLLLMILLTLSKLVFSPKTGVLSILKSPV